MKCSCCSKEISFRKVAICKPCYSVLYQSKKKSEGKAS